MIQYILNIKDFLLRNVSICRQEIYIILPSGVNVSLRPFPGLVFSFELRKATKDNWGFAYFTCPLFSFGAHGWYSKHGAKTVPKI